jgi:hypothetical protein
VAADFGLGLLEVKLAGLLGGQDAATGMAIQLDLPREVEALAGPDAGPLVRLLARRTGLCLLHAVAVEGRVAAQVVEAGQSPRLLEALDRAADKADRRFQRAARMLATVKRLLGPSQAVRIEAKVEGTVDVAVSGRVDVEVGGAVAVDLQGAAEGEEDRGDALAGLLAERAGLGGRCVTGGRN